LVGMLTLLEMKKNPGGSRSSFVRGGVSPAPGLVAAS
jgi:hypothetical protein